MQLPMYTVNQVPMHTLNQVPIDTVNLSTGQFMVTTIIVVLYHVNPFKCPEYENRLF